MRLSGVVAFLMLSIGCAASGPNHGGGGAGGAGGAGGIGGTGGSGGGDPSCPQHCSADLRNLVDCNGNVLKSCAADQACSPDGSCVAPCAGADANKSSIGCDYYSVPPASFCSADGCPAGSMHGECFAAYVANTWGTPVTLTVDYNGQSLNVADFARIPSGQGNAITYAPLPNGQLPAGQLAILFLADDSALNTAMYTTPCPAGIKAGFTASPASSPNTAMIHAFHITSSAPVVAYDTYPYGGALSYITSATLLIPTTAWDTNYVAVDAYPGNTPQATAIQSFTSPFVQVTAAQDGTKVTIDPTVAIVGGTGVAATGQGQSHTYDLNAGDVLQLLQPMELNGSPILADKPIGVWGGHACMDIEAADASCDSAHQQIPPVRALGHEYVAVRPRNRQSGTDEAPPWRILGAVDGTQLTYEPSAPAGAPTTLQQGQLVKFTSAQPFVVRSQDDKHPFYVSGHMGSKGYGGVDHGTGDPEFVNTVPPEQYLASYVFMTDPTIANTHLVLVRALPKDGMFRDVTLDCLGAVTGWMALGSSGTYQYARVDLVTDGAAVGSCNNGRHEIHSDAPFGLTVWGWDDYVSYAYPGGMSVLPINDVLVPPIT
jgi:hypothetical protein